jgi:hypothetical protein
MGFGCSGEFPSGEVSSESAPADDPADNALIESHLEGHGYDTSTLQFQGDTVLVEDDMEMSREVLLDAAKAEADGDVEKGYFYSTGTLFAGKRIQLSFTAAVSTAWRNALNAARTEWNAKTPMFARDPGGNGIITVQVQALKNADGTNNTNTIANGTPPPGRTITLNSNFTAGCGGSLEGLVTATKTYTALHEMGHVLGFAHPPPNPTNNARVHIAGTAANTGLIEPSYATVMAQGCGTRTTLHPDDVLSAQKKYPSCIATCENNCLSLIDPGSIGLCISSCPQTCGG